MPSCRGARFPTPPRTDLQCLLGRCAALQQVESARTERHVRIRLCRDCARTRARVRNDAADAEESRCDRDAELFRIRIARDDGEGRDVMRVRSRGEEEEGEDCFAHDGILCAKKSEPRLSPGPDFVGGESLDQRVLMQPLLAFDHSYW